MGIRSLTQVEAEQRAALLDVERYDVEVDLTDLPTGPEVRCVSTVTFTCREPGAETFVDCAAEVRRRHAQRRRARLPPSDGRIPLPGLAEHNVLRVESRPGRHRRRRGRAQGRRPRRRRGLRVDVVRARRGPLRLGLLRPARPQGRRTRFTVTAPGGVDGHQQHRRPARSRTVGEAAAAGPSRTRRALSTYITVVNAGPFHEIRREAGGYDLGLYGRQSLAPVLERDADELFTVTEQGLAFFGERFAMPFPQRKYDQVFVPDYGRRDGELRLRHLVRRVPAPDARRRTPSASCCAKVLLHEMAHMWFGDIVTMRWWDDLWLNEAFAEFACHWAAVRATRVHRRLGRRPRRRQAAGVRRRPGPDLAPDPPADPRRRAGRVDLRRHHLPQGRLGPAAAHGLRRRGRTSSPGMAAYFARHAWGNTTLQDLIDALAAASGRDLDAWRTGWLETAGTDRLTLERATAAPCSWSPPRRPARGRRCWRSARTAGRRGRGAEAYESSAQVEVDQARRPPVPDLRRRRPLARQRRGPHLRHDPARIAATRDAFFAGGPRCPPPSRAASPSPPCGTC